LIRHRLIHRCGKRRGGEVAGLPPRLLPCVYITYSCVDSHRLPFGYGKHGIQSNIYAKGKNIFSSAMECFSGKKIAGAWQFLPFSHET
jgi:hypothetical protein